MREALGAWQAPESVCWHITTRDTAGVSRNEYASFNLAEHVDEPLARVVQNRQLLEHHLQARYGKSPHLNWLTQVHGTTVHKLSEGLVRPVEADAAYTDVPGQACVVMTADCLPVLLCDDQGREVAAAHAGWRGLASGVIENTVACFTASPCRLQAYLGPAISKQHFQVGEEVRQAFMDASSQSALKSSVAKAFVDDPLNPGKYYADLYALATQALNALGVMRVYGGSACTYENRQHYYSYRRDGRCGRFASMIWLRAS